MKTDMTTKAEHPDADPSNDAAKGKLMRRISGIVTIAGFVVLGWAAFIFAPEDLSQGPPQRIFYVHVPSAWIGFMAFFVVFIYSIKYLIKRDLRSDEIAAASAEVGLVFTTGVLITGPIWARPVWGVYWSWDPRLTSFLVLWLIYLSYVALRQYVPDPATRAKFSAVLGIVGFLDVPIVYLSVQWWRALHPASVVFARGGPQMPGTMLVALLVGVATFTAFYIYLLALRLHVGRLSAAKLANEEEEPA